MIQIKAILLDIGGVLWHPKEPPLHINWAARCGLGPEEFDEIVYNSEWGAQALLGNITGEEMWENIGNKLGLSPMERRECQKEYWLGVWDTEFLDYCHTLKSKCKLGIVSDAELNAREQVKTWVNESLFDVIVFSAEVGVRKPDPKIFHRSDGIKNVRYTTLDTAGGRDVLEHRTSDKLLRPIPQSISRG